VDKDCSIPVVQRLTIDDSIPDIPDGFIETINHPGESIAVFTRRHEVKQLQEKFSV
jgi:hypothetical protein